MAPGFPSQRGDMAALPRTGWSPFAGGFLCPKHTYVQPKCVTIKPLGTYVVLLSIEFQSTACVRAAPGSPLLWGWGVSSVDYRTGACLGSFFHVWAFNHWLKVLAIFSPRYLFSPSRGDLTSLPSSGSMSGYCCCWHTTLLHPLYRVGGREVAVLLDSDGKPAQWCYANLLNPGLMPYLQGFLLCIAVPPAKQSTIISFQLP